MQQCPITSSMSINTVQTCVHIYIRLQDWLHHTNFWHTDRQNIHTEQPKLSAMSGCYLIADEIAHNQEANLAQHSLFLKINSLLQRLQLSILIGATLYRIVPSKADFPDRRTKGKEKHKKGGGTKNRIMVKERIGKERIGFFKSLCCGLKGLLTEEEDFHQLSFTKCIFNRKISGFC